MICCATLLHEISVPNLSLGPFGTEPPRFRVHTIALASTTVRIRLAGPLTRILAEL